jgi:hemerythrin-like domain-containing protein
MAAQQLFTSLRKDHREMEDLLRKLAEADAGEAKELMSALRDELVPHMEAEESVLYSWLQETKSTRHHALLALEEHDVAEFAFQGLEGAAPGEDRFHAKASVILELLEHHHKEEERDVFADIRATKSAEEIDELFARFDEEKERLRKRL